MNQSQLSRNIYRRVASFALVLAWCVVMLGAYTRLTDAGLGCPDWPGCYGQWIVSSAEKVGAHAAQAYPDQPLEWVKARTEMIHRYAAGTLGLCIFFLVVGGWLSKRIKIRPRFLPVFLFLLLIGQALLGMWTVTLQLLPLVVMGHLLGGILIFGSLCYWRWQLSNVSISTNRDWRPWIGLGCLILFIQIALGGWVSANYAGIACLGFPTCNGAWWPDLQWLDAFHLFSSTDVNHQGGLLSQGARVTIQFVHRLGAYVTTAYLLSLAVILLKQNKDRLFRTMIIITLILLLIQFSLGMVNVLFLLPLWSAVLHNGVAALLLAAMVSQYYLASGVSNAS